MSDFSFLLNLTTGTVTSDTDVNGLYKVPISEKKVFLYNKESYLLYNFTTTLVKHKNAGFGDMETKYFDHILAMKEDEAIKILENLVNVLQNQVCVTIGEKELEVEASLEDTIEAIKETVLLKLHENRVNIDGNFKQVVEILVNQLKEYKPQDMLNSLPEMTKLNLRYPENVNSSQIISDLIKYIVFHNTFHDSIINNRSISVFPDTVFLLALVCVIMGSFNVKVVEQINFTNLHDLLIHCIIEAIYNLVTMRLDRELFIMERNENATAIKKKYYNNFPILKKNKPVDELFALLNNDSKFMKAIELESVKMFPFIALYSLSDKQRVKICYTKCSKNPDFEKAYNNKIKWIQPEKFISLLEDFSKHHSTDFSRYDTNLFIDIVEHFIGKVTTTEEEEMQM